MAAAQNDRCVEHDGSIKDHERRINGLEKVVYGNGDPGLKGMVNEMWRFFLRTENNRTVALSNLIVGACNLAGLVGVAILLHKLGIGGVP